MTKSSANVSSRPIPQVDVLFLGDPGIGKATFASNLPFVEHPSVSRRAARSSHLGSQTCNTDVQLTSPSTTTLPPLADEDVQPPPYVPIESSPQRQPCGQSSSSAHQVHPLAGPLTFSVSLFGRPYCITLHPSTGQLFTDAFPTEPPPRFAIIAYSIPDRVTLHNARNYWMMHLRDQYPDEEGMKVMLLGLKRDLRTDKNVTGQPWNSNVARDPASEGPSVGKGAREIAGSISMTDAKRHWEEYECVMAEEGLQTAREMRADQYAECSAKTGELMWQVVEDITRTAAKTTVEDGRGASGSCIAM